MVFLRSNAVRQRLGASKERSSLNILSSVELPSCEEQGSIAVLAFRTVLTSLALLAFRTPYSC
jgi:hypothetical protein